MTERLKEFLQQKKWRQLKKTDWIAAALVGVLLLVVAMPSGGTGVHISENKKEDTAQEKTEQKYEKKCIRCRRYRRKDRGSTGSKKRNFHGDSNTAELSGI